MLKRTKNMLLSEHKARKMLTEELEKEIKINTKTIFLFVALFIIAAFFLYGYTIEGDGWKRFVMFCTLFAAGGLGSLFFELYILKREMRERVG